MTAVKNFLDRMPRVLLFAAAAVIQVALIALLVLDRVQILRTGREVTLQTRPVDPRDFLRGDYVVLRYGISTVSDGALTPTSKGKPVFVKLAPGSDGFHKVASVHKEPVPLMGSEILLRGRVSSGSVCRDTGPGLCGALTVDYGLEQYFVPQGEGRAIEQARNQDKVSVVAAVAADGRAAIKRLLLDGKPVYDEPLF